MHDPTPAAPPPKTASVVYNAIRGLGFVALVLILVSILYSAWIAISNWGDIQV